MLGNLFKSIFLRNRRTALFSEHITKKGIENLGIITFGYKKGKKGFFESQKNYELRVASGIININQGR